MAEYTGRKVLLKDEDDNAIIPYVDGVIDSNTSNTVKTWTGTKAQYDALIKDNNTLYNITDDESNIINTINDLINSTNNRFNAMLDSVYPVGSVYLSTNSICPLARLITGSAWEQVGTTIITDVDTSVAVMGDGTAVGWTDGTTLAGSTNYTGEGMILTTAAYGTNVGTKSVGGGSKPSNSVATGLTTDSSKSGIVGTLTRTSISVYIFKRIA